MRQRTGLPPRTGVAQRETGCQGEKRVPDREEENKKNDEGVDQGQRQSFKLPYNFPHVLKICVILSKAGIHKVCCGRGCKFVYIQVSIEGQGESHFHPCS